MLVCNILVFLLLLNAKYDIVSRVGAEGKAAAEPKQYEVSEEERALAEQLKAATMSDAPAPGSASSKEAGLPSELRMETYDDEFDGIRENLEMDAASDAVEGEDGNDSDGSGDAGSDAGDTKLNLNTDAVLLAALTEEDFSSIEVHVFDESNGSFYVHHDIALPAFPLSLSWVGADSMSHVAVGTFYPVIEIWNLDVMDVLEPAMILGGLPPNSPNAPAGAQQLPGGITLTSDAHSDAVLSVAWNSIAQSALASGSADKTVKVWDLATQQCVRTFDHHTDKVQVVAWHPEEESILTSGSFDRTVCMLDSRMATAEAISKAASYQLAADIESMTWNPHNAAQFVVSCEDGSITSYDVRAGPSSAPLFSFKAHSEAVSSVTFSASVNGLLATASSDKRVRIWDYQELCKAPESSSTKRKAIAEKEMNVGELFDCVFYPSSPFLLAAAGNQGAIALWDAEEDAAVEAAFSGRANAADINSISTTNAVAEAIAAQPPAPASEGNSKSGKKKKKGKRKRSDNSMVT